MASDFILQLVLKAKDEASKAFQNFRQQLTSTGTELMTLGTKLSLGLTAPLALAGRAAIQFSTDFEAAMTAAQTMTGSSAEQFEIYKSSVLELTRVLPQNAVTLTEALYSVASAGFRGQEAIDILSVAGRAATNAMADVQVVTQSVTSVLSSYGLNASNAGWVTDALTMGVIEGTAEFEAFAGSIGRVLPIAAQAGVSFQEVMASLATMTRAGLSADEATTALRSTLVNLFAPSAQSIKALDAMGLSADELRLSITDKGLLATLQMLMDKTGGNVEVLDQLIPNVRGLVGVLATAGTQGETYSEILTKVQNSMGATGNAFTTTSETARVQWGLLGNALNEIKLLVGDALMPILLSVADTLRGWAERLAEVNPQTLDFSVKIGLILAAAGPVITILGGLVTAIGALLSPIGLVVAAVAGLALAWNNDWGGIQEKTRSVLEYIQPIIANKMNDIKDVVSLVSTAINYDWKSAWNDVYNEASTAVDGIWTKVSGTITWILTWLGQQKQAVVDGFQNLFKGIHIPLPHFTVNWSNVLGVQVPSGFDVQWYGKGLTNGVFNRPTLIGVGERGPEAVNVTPLGGGRGGGGGQMTLVFNYAPMMSLANEREAYDKIAPVIREVLRRENRR